MEGERLRVGICFRRLGEELQGVGGNAKGGGRIRRVGKRKVGDAQTRQSNPLAVMLSCPIMRLVS